MSVLPDKIGDLIRVAIKDLEECEADPNYLIEMDYWHYPVGLGNKKICMVCLARSVMAKTIGVDYGVCNPAEVQNKEDEDKLLLLNWLRKIMTDYEEFHCYEEFLGEVPGLGSLIEAGELFDAVPYYEDPRQFKSDMLVLASLMNKHNVHYVGAKDI